MIKSKKLIIFIAIIIIIFFYLYCYTIEKFEDDMIPKVEFPFKNLFDDKGNMLNIILIAAPFREAKHEELYEEYMKKGYDFCGISSYLNFPDKIINPYEDRFHEEKGHNYINMVTSWLHCFRNIPNILKDSNLPQLLLTEADLKDYDQYKPDDSIKKEYDFMYVCLSDNDKCEPGWQSYNRNWELAKKCLEVMCGKYNLKGVMVGRQNCDYTDKCTGLIKIHPLLPFNEFQKEMQKCRFLFVPNISDASPRVITEAICYNMPVLVNYNIIGGWHNVISGITGETFVNEEDIDNALDILLNNYDKYTPREWFMENRGKKKSGKILADFLIKTYPNINNKNMEYVTITI
jgi:hypothetical protein